MHRFLQGASSLSNSSPSLPCISEEDEYKPLQGRSCSSVIEEKLGGDRSKVVMRVAVGISLLLLFSCALFNQNNDRYRRLSSVQHHPRPTRTLLFDDGTLSTPQSGGQDSLCDYLTQSSRRHTSVKMIHVYFDEFKIKDYLGAKLIANAAQVPLVMSGVNLRALVDQAYRIGPIPKDHGKQWTVEHLCQRCTLPLCQDHLHLLPPALQKLPFVQTLEKLERDESVGAAHTKLMNKTLP